MNWRKPPKFSSGVEDNSPFRQEGPTASLRVNRIVVDFLAVAVKERHDDLAGMRGNHDVGRNRGRRRRWWQRRWTRSATGTSSRSWRGAKGSRGKRAGRWWCSKPGTPVPWTVWVIPHSRLVIRNSRVWNTRVARAFPQHDRRRRTDRLAARVTGVGTRSKLGANRRCRQCCSSDPPAEWHYWQDEVHSSRRNRR